MLKDSSMKSMKGMKVILCTPSTRWTAEEYDMKDCCLVVGQCDLAMELKKMGGVRWCCGSSSSFLSFLSLANSLPLPPSSPTAVDMPEGDGLVGLMDAMKYNSQMVLLNPEEKGMMMMPVGSSLFPLLFSISSFLLFSCHRC
jgi:hypothetical protein